MRWIKALFLLPILAACSEQQLCISDATRDLRQVRAFVAESRGNLDRGFALAEKQEVVYDLEKCGENADGSPVFCRVPVIETRKVPVAIDLDAEAAKLRSLQKKEAALAVRAAEAVKICEATFPE